MKALPLAAALLLTSLPGLAFGMCSGNGHQEATMSCAEGTTWDKDTGTCVPIVSG